MCSRTLLSKATLPKTSLQIFIWMESRMFKYPRGLAYDCPKEARLGVVPHTSVEIEHLLFLVVSLGDTWSRNQKHLKNFTQGAPGWW